MRKLFLVVGLGLVFSSGLLVFAGRKRDQGAENSATRAVQQVLSSQNSALIERLDDSLARADRDAAQVLSRWGKKPKMQSFLTDTALAEPGLPKWAIVAGRRIRAAGNVGDALLEDALEAHAGSGARLGIHSSTGKVYLLVRGILEGQPYALAYAPDSFFSAFRSTDGMRVWLALKDGTILYHPLQRFIGSNAANLKPVASGIQFLKSGKASTFSQKYLGLEGREAIGAWASIPTLGLLMGSEWPREIGASADGSVFFVFALVAGLGGAFLLGVGIRPAAVGPGRGEQLFDVSRLDDDAMEYLESAKLSAEKAIEFAKEREKEMVIAHEERAEALSRQRYLEQKLEIMNEFEEKILPLATGKQVWSELGRVFAERVPGLAVVVYRYSSSSFSLVPDSVFTGMELPENALAYLKDARIFIGNTNLLQSVLTTEALSRWNRARGKHMPLHQTEFRAVPFSGQGGAKGVLLVLFDYRMNQEDELEPSLDLLQILVGRIATFCDTFGRLLQSYYAKGSAWKAVASASDDARNRSRPS